MIWLGSKRGYLSDWVTQCWVKLTGRKLNLSFEKWLEGPCGKTVGIGSEFFEDYACESNLVIQPESDEHGLIEDFRSLSAPDFEPSTIDPAVVYFYEHTANYELEAWAEWSGPFRFFGKLLSSMFSRRLQQLNVPLNGLDTSRGMTNKVLKLTDPDTGTVRYTTWVRKLVATGNVLYAGGYSLCSVPLRKGACVKVVFPLPNGNAIVIMRPQSHPDGSFSLTSSGVGFGDAGFYFNVQDPRDKSLFSVRYIQALQETIRVYQTEAGDLRADHVLNLWGMTFLRLHYKLNPKTQTYSDQRKTRFAS